MQKKLTKCDYDQIAFNVVIYQLQFLLLTSQRQACIVVADSDKRHQVRWY